MAPIGQEVMGSWAGSSGTFSPEVAVLCLLCLVLSIFLVALCNDCGRRSFDLQEPRADRNPPALVRVVRLEEAVVARENPMIDEIKNDEKESRRLAVSSVSTKEEATWVQPWRSHLGLQHQQDINSVTPSDLPASQVPADKVTQNLEFSSLPTTGNSSPDIPVPSSLDHNGSEPKPSLEINHIYDIIGKKRHGGLTPLVEAGFSSSELQYNSTTSHEVASDQGHSFDVHSPHALEVEEQEEWADRSWNPTYAQVSRKVNRLTPPSVPAPEGTVGEESLPPLPNRNTELEG